MKKIVCIVLFIVLTAFLLTGCLYTLYDPVPKGYIKEDDVFDEGLRDFTSYSKYYYNKDGEKLFLKNRDFLKVKKSDLNTLGRFCEDFKEIAGLIDKRNEFNMKKSQITEGDYYRIENWWYGKAEQDDWLKEMNDDLEDDESSRDKLEITPINENGRMRLVKTDDKEAVDYSLSCYYTVYIYDTESSTLYRFHNDT